jgi:hypothetical protein
MTTSRRTPKRNRAHRFDLVFSGRHSHRINDCSIARSRFFAIAELEFEWRFIWVVIKRFGKRARGFREAFEWGFSWFRFEHFMLGCKWSWILVKEFFVEIRNYYATSKNTQTTIFSFPLGSRFAKHDSRNVLTNKSEEKALSKLRSSHASFRIASPIPDYENSRCFVAVMNNINSRRRQTKEQVFWSSTTFTDNNPMRLYSLPSLLQSVAFLVFLILAATSESNHYAEALDSEEYDVKVVHQRAQVVGGAVGRHSNRHLRSGQPQKPKRISAENNNNRQHQGENTEYIPGRRMATTLHIDLLNERHTDAAEGAP